VTVLGHAVAPSHPRPSGAESNDDPVELAERMLGRSPKA
jgi:hypothetical protein